MISKIDSISENIQKRYKFYDYTIGTFLIQISLIGVAFSCVFLGVSEINLLYQYKIGRYLPVLSKTNFESYYAWYQSSIVTIVGLFVFLIEWDY